MYIQRYTQIHAHYKHTIYVLIKHHTHTHTHTHTCVCTRMDIYTNTTHTQLTNNEDNVVTNFIQFEHIKASHKITTPHGVTIVRWLLIVTSLIIMILINTRKAGYT